MADIESNLLNSFAHLNDASDVKLSWKYDDLGKQMIGWKTWTLDGYGNNNSHEVSVWKSEKENGTKYIKFLNEMYDKNYKMTFNLIEKVRYHPDGFIRENLEDGLSTSERRYYFLEYCKKAYLHIDNRYVYFTEDHLRELKNKSEQVKILFCLRIGITLPYLNNKLSLF